jgi:uncharacterized protein YidB (DUF937 family)
VQKEEDRMGLLDVLGGGRNKGGGVSPITLALLGLLAYRTYKGKGRLAEMLGRDKAPAGRNKSDDLGGGLSTGAGESGGLGGLLGGLGGLLGGGAAGGILSGGLKDLIDQFQENGQGDKARSWVSEGPNKAVSPAELEQALGEERIQWLMEQTGLSRQELLDGLSRELPGAVDRLTPEGHLPNEREAERLAG